jgi:hypothetical protein
VLLHGRVGPYEERAAVNQPRFQAQGGQLAYRRAALCSEVWQRWKRSSLSDWLKAYLVAMVWCCWCRSSMSAVVAEVPRVEDPSVKGFSGRPDLRSKGRRHWAQWGQAPVQAPPPNPHRESSIHPSSESQSQLPVSRTFSCCRHKLTPSITAHNNPRCLSAWASGP